MQRRKGGSKVSEEPPKSLKGLHVQDASKEGIGGATQNPIERVAESEAWKSEGHNNVKQAGQMNLAQALQQVDPAQCAWEETELELNNRGFPGPPNLGRCEGDCQTDEDCQPGLTCWQRNKTGDPGPPGCFGTPKDESQYIWDYCYCNTPAPTPQPTPRPTPEPQCTPAGPLKFENKGVDPTEKLGQCAGDCDKDSDCEEGLSCFHRDNDEQDGPLNCIGEIRNDPLPWDYCHCPPPAQCTPALEPLPLDHVAVTPDHKLKQCAGDCDKDSDCEEGLLCFRRDAGEQAGPPGCSGTPKNSPAPWDYCYCPGTQQSQES